MCPRLHNLRDFEIWVLTGVTWGTLLCNIPAVKGFTWSQSLKEKLQNSILQYSRQTAIKEAGVMNDGMDHKVKLLARLSSEFTGWWPIAIKLGCVKVNIHKTK